MSPLRHGPGVSRETTSDAATEAGKPRKDLLPAVQRVQESVPFLQMWCGTASTKRSAISGSTTTSEDQRPTY